MLNNSIDIKFKLSSKLCAMSLPWLSSNSHDRLVLGMYVIYCYNLF
jgi:hypothetical protein